jgi:hypothetical protein
MPEFCLAGKCEKVASNPQRNLLYFFGYRKQEADPIQGHLLHGRMPGPPRIGAMYRESFLSMFSVLFGATPHASYPESAIFPRF